MPKDNNICKICGRPERVGNAYHTHDLDHIFGLGTWK